MRCYVRLLGARSWTSPSRATATPSSTQTMPASACRGAWTTRRRQQPSTWFGYVPTLTAVAPSHSSVTSYRLQHAYGMVAPLRWVAAQQGTAHEIATLLTDSVTVTLSTGCRCCAACKAKAAKGCNVWVWCGDPGGLCWTPDVWCAQPPLGSYHGRAPVILCELLDWCFTLQKACHTGGCAMTSSPRRLPMCCAQTTEQPRCQVCVDLSKSAGITPREPAG